ncbi:hypothetical protein N7453_010174 [Penicillium expansum]|nr:hypothetical protein N7453_010174 [Penicillium expansum]
MVYGVSADKHNFWFGKLNEDSEKLPFSQTDAFPREFKEPRESKISFHVKDNNVEMMEDT